MRSNARYYDPGLGRFISADTVVPGNASGGMDGVAIKQLTVAFHETPFLGKLNGENQLGPWFTLSDEQQQDLGSPWGPANPQSLNRYSYVMSNPMRWVDPSGHQTYTKAQAARLRYVLVTEVIPNLTSGQTLEDLVIAAISEICGDFCAAIISSRDTDLGAVIDTLNTIVNELNYFIDGAPDDATITIKAQRYAPCGGPPIGCTYTNQLHVAWSNGQHLKEYSISAATYATLVGMGLEFREGLTDPLSILLNPQHPYVRWGGSFNLAGTTF